MLSEKFMKSEELMFSDDLALTTNSLEKLLDSTFMVEVEQIKYEFIHDTQWKLK